MSQQFYIAVNGQKTGPFSLEELKSKDIQKDTLMWTEGLDNWTKADHIPLLKDILRAIPPPLTNSGSSQNTSQNVPPPPITNKPAQDKYFGYELASNFQRFWASIIEGIIISIPVMIFGGIEETANAGIFNPDLIFAMTLIYAVLGAIFYPLWSGNIGHKILGLKVISSVNGDDYNKSLKGALREGLKNIMSVVFIPVIWLLWDGNNQNLYDKVLKTYVVKKKGVQ